MLRRTTQIALGTVLVAATAAFAPVAHADRVGFNVSIGGPGYGVAFGNGPYWRGSHYYQPYCAACPVHPAGLLRAAGGVPRAARGLPRPVRGAATRRRGPPRLLRVLRAASGQAVSPLGQITQAGNGEPVVDLSLRGLPAGHRAGEEAPALFGLPQQAYAAIGTGLDGDQPRLPAGRLFFEHQRA